MTVILKQKDCDKEHRCYSTRMRGEGLMVQSINRLFELSKAKYFQNTEPRPKLRTYLFVKTSKGQMGLF